MNRTRASIRVAAGILRDGDGQVLLTDRTHAGSMQQYWEFPGGKREQGEDGPAALGRELFEELGVQIESCEHLTTIDHEYPEQRVCIDFYLVDSWRGSPQGREGQKLAWIPITELDAARILPADAPVIVALRAS